MCRWYSTGELPDGSPYRDHGVHIVRMRWGEASEIDADQDSQAVAAGLQLWDAAGAAEALEPPIIS